MFNIKKIAAEILKIAWTKRELDDAYPLLRKALDRAIKKVAPQFDYSIRSYSGADVLDLIVTLKNWKDYVEFSDEVKDDEGYVEFIDENPFDYIDSSKKLDRLIKMIDKELVRQSPDKYKEIAKRACDVVWKDKTGNDLFNLDDSMG